jgi:membrane peptidoglycan carboxypeptidase
VAAEDKSFYHHYGINPIAFVRAFVANVMAGHIVQGGSSITQQTVENVFNRTGRSVFTKIQEILDAIRMEMHYSKEQILEFYSNQFFVYSNGRGLSIAANYFFNKSAADLNLIECAFIAGSVKAPNHYNPFNKKTPKLKQKALEKANVRKNYVINNMYELGMITEKERLNALEAPVPFKPGKFAYDTNTIIDMVSDEIMSEPIQTILRDNGIGNIATSGIKIVTTLDYDSQGALDYYFRKGLSRLDLILSQNL